MNKNNNYIGNRYGFMSNRVRIAKAEKIIKILNEEYCHIYRSGFTGSLFFYIRQLLSLCIL